MALNLKGRRPAGIVALLLLAAAGIMACDYNVPLTPSSIIALPTDTPGPPTATAPAEAQPTAAIQITATAQPTAAINDLPAGSLWQNVGLAGQELFAVAAGSGAGDPIYAGGTGLYQSADGGATWTALPLGDGAAAVDWINISPSDSNLVYAGSGANCYGGPEGGQWRSRDEGKSWEPLPVAHHSLLTDKVDPARITAMSCTSVVRSTDFGQTWTELADPAIAAAGNVVGQMVALAPGAPDVIYALYTTEGGTGLLRRSTDSGATWGPAAANIELLGPSDMLVDATDTQHILIVDQNGVYSSTDGGQTLQPQNGGLEASRIDAPGNPYALSDLAARYNAAGDSLDQLFVGSFGADNKMAPGVFAAPGAGTRWALLGSLDDASVSDLAVARSKDASGSDATMLYAATDNGVYSIALP